jgi:hypothetical protein
MAEPICRRGRSALRPVAGPHRRRQISRSMRHSQPLPHVESGDCIGVVWCVRQLRTSWSGPRAGGHLVRACRRRIRASHSPAVQGDETAGLLKRGFNW